MVQVSSINGINSKTALEYENVQNPIIEEDNGIFETTAANDTSTAENAEALYQKLADIEADNGAILDTWNNFKEITGKGTSASKCENAIQQYENGEITYDEALETVETFESKQDSSLDLFSNIATGIVAIGAVALATALTGGAALPIIAAIAIGAGAGAVTKAAIKTADRATNEVEGDALDAKQITKDALSGAVTGGIAAATAGTGEAAISESIANYTGKTAIKDSAKEAGKTVAKYALKSAKTGLITGSVAGSSNYLINCTFDEDKDFDLKEFADTTATSAAVGGVVGGIMGGVTGSLRVSDVLTASDTNVAANSASNASYKVMNDRIRAISA